MADNSGGMGAMGVIIGALLVLVIGGAVLFGTGMIGGGNTSTVKIEAPKIPGNK
jgi:hypothetical protein